MLHLNKDQLLTLSMNQQSQEQHYLSKKTFSSFDFFENRLQNGTKIQAVPCINSQTPDSYLKVCILHLILYVSLTDLCSRYSILIYFLELFSSLFQ